MMQRASAVFPKIIAIVLALAVSFFSVAALTLDQAQAASGSPKVSVTRAATGKVVIKKGSTYKLAAKTSAGKLMYKSSKPKVVSVSKKGVLKAKAVGKATITVKAKSAGKTTTKKIEVSVVKVSKFKKVKKITAKASATSLAVGKSAKVSVSFNPKKASNKNVIFKSSAPAVVKVTAAGKIIAQKAGAAKITVTSCDNKKAKATVTVKVTKPAPATPAPTEPSSIALGTLRSDISGAQVGVPETAVFTVDVTGSPESPIIL